MIHPKEFASSIQKPDGWVLNVYHNCVNITPVRGTLPSVKIEERRVIVEERVGKFNAKSLTHKFEHSRDAIAFATAHLERLAASSSPS